LFWTGGQLHASVDSFVGTLYMGISGACNVPLMFQVKMATVCWFSDENELLKKYINI
jgi:hypothetical protein